jgi:ribosome-binding ATPase
MGFTCGIVGLPNVGKSTLFNALASARAQADNYPFCTIEPNVAIVAVPDARLDALARVVRPPKVVPATLELVDIAGLVRGASKGEGLGNQFLAHIREVSAILHVVRCYEDANVVHLDNRIDPVSDADTIATELCLKDIETVQKRRERAHDMLKANRPEDKIAVDVCDVLLAHLDEMKPMRTLLGDKRLSTPEAASVVRDLFLLTAKPVLYIANIDEASVGDPGANRFVAALREKASREGTTVVPICASLEAQIAELEPADRPEFLASAGLAESGLLQVLHAGYALLGLITFLTIGDAEVRAWTIEKGTAAPRAAGKIHTDFERGFIRAEVVHWADWERTESVAKCREVGKLFVEGKDYVVEDGDVVHFKFNV